MVSRSLSLTQAVAASPNWGMFSKLLSKALRAGRPKQLLHHQRLHQAALRASRAAGCNCPESSGSAGTLAHVTARAEILTTTPETREPPCAGMHHAERREHS